MVDGLVNGAVGKLVRIEQNDENQVTRIWLVFPDKNTGMVAKKKSLPFLRNIISLDVQYLSYVELQVYHSIIIKPLWEEEIIFR